MHNSNDLFGLLLRIILKNTFNPNHSGNPNDKKAENELTLAAIGILAFVGADAMKVIFRANFGSQGLSLFRVVLAFIAFLMVAASGIICFGDPEFDLDPRLGSHESYIIVSIFYVFLAFYVLIKGIKHKKGSSTLNIHPDYAGDSILLSGLIKKDGWSQRSVQNWAEPFFILTLGGLLTAINFMWGIPIIFCALSIWAHQIAGYVLGWDTVSKKMQQHGYRKDDYPNIHY